jgi:hypothetical protein
MLFTHCCQFSVFIVVLLDNGLECYLLIVASSAYLLLLCYLTTVWSVIYSLLPVQRIYCCCVTWQRFGMLFTHCSKWNVFVIVVFAGRLCGVFHILDYVRTTKRSEPLEKFTNWERSQSLVSNKISPRIEVNYGIEADKVVHIFTASVASAFGLPISRVTLSDLNNDLPGIDRLLDCERWVDARVHAVFETASNDPPPLLKYKALWPTELNILPNAKKVLWNWWHYKLIPQAPS